MWNKKISNWNQGRHNVGGTTTVVGRVRDQKSIFGHAVTKIGHESARIFLKNLNFRFRVKIWYGLQIAFNAPKTCYKRYFNEKNN